MKKLHGNTACVLILLIACLLFFSFAHAQEEFYRLEHTDIFGKLRRPPITFSHETHVVALDSQGCGACHHAPDENTGELVYIEDEEITCSECHLRKEDDGTPALREAFHGNCNGCHRRMIKEKKNFKGPTTCGECHVPEKVLKQN